MSGVAVLGWLLPGIPLAAALLGLALTLLSENAGRTARRVAIGLGVTGAAGTLAAAVALLVALDAPAESSRPWIDFGGLAVSLTVRLDGTVALVAVAVAAVALAVQVYSTAYLGPGSDDDPDADRRYLPYAAQISLFTAAMLLVVVSGDLILLLIGWEVMGICSYLLIAHDRRLPGAPAAAMKAFLVTRAGDIGFILGVALLGLGAGSFRIADVLAHDYSAATLTAATLLLLAGVAGKSAQFPLHSWLPDAMAGPTPISALIHAATMVAAGVYVVARLYPLFAAAPVTLTVLGLLAVITLLGGALAATAQDDIKRVLAWSTVSQVGFMAGALAVGSPPAALFHLLSHAAFKALLFLAAGAVIHAVGTASMSAMGGLRRGMPVTFWCTTIGLAALAGLPPLSGFWSKDGILAAAWDTARHGGGETPAWLAWLVWLAGLVTVAITAWYATRLLLRAFAGDSRTADLHPHDPPAAMRVPLLVLAVPAALLGLLGFWPAFADRLGGSTAALAGDGTVGENTEVIHLGPELALPVLLLVLGAGLAWWRWRRQPAADPAAALGPLRPAFANAFWFDTLQNALVVRPVRALARLARRGDEGIVDGAVEGTGRATLALGGGLAALHRAALPRALATALAGVLLIGLATVLILGGAR